jgi:serine/threonine protein kinase
MSDFSHICPNCCQETGDGGGYCPVCGIDAASIKNEEFCIPAGSVLLDRYFIGKVIGQGGFGITYLGYDAKFKTKIALKEYFPHGYAFREIHKEKHTVYSLSGDKTEFFNRGIEKFIAEAKRLAQFSGSPGIVNVRDYFSENNTAYIVMEFVEGQPLEEIIEKRGRLSEAEVTAIFLPIIKTLQKVHAAGILHRDIAPDNIMVEPDGTARLIDFGASAEVDESAKTSAAVIKHFYVPEEQYDSNRRRQGAWTDVYALCATIFRALEGDNLPDALERLRGMPFDGFTVPVSAPVKAAVIHGLALFQKDRAQNVEELLEAFSGVGTSTSVYKKPKKDKTPKTAVHTPEDKKRPTKLIAAALGGVAAIAAVCLIIFLPRTSVPVGGEVVGTGETVSETTSTTTSTTTAITTAGTTVETSAVSFPAGNFPDWVSDEEEPEQSETQPSETVAVVTTAPNNEQNQTTTAATTAKKVTDGYVEDFDYYVTLGIGPGKYTGNLKDGKPEGKGVYTASSGSYDGEWKNGLPNGTGTLIRPNEWDREYTGGFKDGTFEGQGTIKYENNTWAEGEFKNGMRNGKITEYQPNDPNDENFMPGTFFVTIGEQVNGQWVGKCERYWTDKDGSKHINYCEWVEDGSHCYGDFEGDPITTRHYRIENPDGSIDEGDDVFVNGQYTENINNTHTEP